MSVVCSIYHLRNEDNKVGICFFNTKSKKCTFFSLKTFSSKRNTIYKTAMELLKLIRTFKPTVIGIEVIEVLTMMQYYALTQVLLSLMIDKNELTEDMEVLFVYDKTITSALRSYEVKAMGKVSSFFKIEDVINAIKARFKIEIDEKHVNGFLIAMYLYYKDKPFGPYIYRKVDRHKSRFEFTDAVIKIDSYEVIVG